MGFGTAGTADVDADAAAAAAPAGRSPTSAVTATNVGATSFAKLESVIFSTFAFLDSVRLKYPQLTALEQELIEVLQCLPIRHVDLADVIRDLDAVLQHELLGAPAGQVHGDLRRRLVLLAQRISPPRHAQEVQPQTVNPTLNDTSFG